MNKNIIAAAVLAASAGTASAQGGVPPPSAVTIYGIVDAGWVRETGGAAGIVNKLTSGVGAYSRLGFRGTEDLGGGLSAFFTLEAGFRVDTGELDTPNTLFQRQAFVGLKSPGGQLTLGRQYTPLHQALTQVADPFATGYAAGSKNLFPDFGTNIRTSNTVQYTSPVFEGITGELAYAFGEQPGSNKAGHQLGAAIGYSNGPLNVRLAYNNKNNDVVPAPGVTPVTRTVARNTLLAANYDFKVVKAYFAVQVDKGFNSAPLGNNSNPFGGVPPRPSFDGREFLLGLSAPVGPGTLLASAQHKNDKTPFNQDANAWGVGYLYTLSKRTLLYAVYGTVDNQNGAGYTVNNNTEAGTGDRAINLGVRHSF
jgi:predicted porin